MVVAGPARPGVRMQPRLAESIAAELRERILNGTLADGALPRQDDLIAMFGVSAPPLREALRILEVEGLITVRRGKVGGAVVHRPDGGSVAHAIGMVLQGEQVHLRDLAEAILNLEPTCAAACAARAESREAKDAVGDGPAFTHAARQFHDLVVAHMLPVTTRLVIRSLVATWSVQEETWAYEASQVGRYPTADNQRVVLNAHRRIAAKIFEGDPAGAERHARAHLRAVQQLVLDEFGDRVIDASSPRAVRAFRDVLGARSGHNDDNRPRGLGVL
jgi:GntR family transcriptional regulator, transcriptional repressor for pyruvate dehydrogenase complex